MGCRTDRTRRTVTRGGYGKIGRCNRGSAREAPALGASEVAVVARAQGAGHRRPKGRTWFGVPIIKGWFRCGDGSRCDPLTIADGYSRRLLRCQAAKHPDLWYTKPLFAATCREYGLPAYVRIDNGAPFASVGIRGLSELSVWWMKLGSGTTASNRTNPRRMGGPAACIGR